MKQLQMMQNNLHNLLQMKLKKFSLPKKLIAFSVLASLLLLPCSLSALDSQSTQGLSQEQTTHLNQSLQNNNQELIASQELSTNLPNLTDPSKNPWDSLREWIDYGKQGLQESSESLETLEQQLNLLKVETSEQKSLLMQSQELLTSLKNSLQETQSNLNKAGEDILAINDTNQQIISLSESILRDNERLLRQQKLSPYVTIGGITLSAGGGSLMTYGLLNDNSTALYTGAALIGIPILVYSVGHWLFQWW